MSQEREKLPVFMSWLITELAITLGLEEWIVFGLQDSSSYTDQEWDAFYGRKWTR